MSLFELSIVVLLNGIIVVFAVLAILTLITIGYGKLIDFLKVNILKTLKQDNNVKKVNMNKNTIDSNKYNKDLESRTVAVISATVYTFLDTKNKKYKIKHIKPINKQNLTSNWKLAGLFENISLS